ncbi:MAG TPA: prolyl oligopeptidase family serine peptidase, partial [Acidimicrobiia bacterium]|nr:prolyl oligopeptidase family serine peptidase [Acidimicrobiia bacterium]
MADPRLAPAGDRLAWIDSFDGRADLVVAALDGSAPPVIVTADGGVGGGYAWAGDDLVVARGDGSLAVVSVTGVVSRVLSQEGRAFAPAVSARGLVAIGLERADACDIATVPLDGSAWPVRVSHADYAWDPAWSPDGRALVWSEWDLPNMPWEQSRVMVHEDGATKVVADAPWCGQPRFSPDGSRLAYVRDGALWVDDRPVLEERFEHAEPPWSPGQRSYAWSPLGDELAWCRNEDGFGRLVIGAPERRSARELSKGWHRGIEWNAHGIICARSGAVTPPQVVVLAPNGSSRRTIARGAVAGFEATSLVEPRPVTWRSGNATVHGLLWRPAGSARRGLIVQLHGGPTGQALADWNARVQWLTQLGFTVLQVNYRGSTGYGREYREALDGGWGERDVADVSAGIRHAVKEGWGAANRVVVMGGSAGGFTALNVAARHPELVVGVIALYPVTDLL